MFSGRYLINDRNEAFVKAGVDVYVVTPVPSRGVHPSEIKYYKKHFVIKNCQNKMSSLTSVNI